MKSGIAPKKPSREHNRFLRYYFPVFLIAILIGTIVSINTLLKHSREDVQVVPDLYAKNLGAPINRDVDQYLGQYVREQIIPYTNFPMVFTDSTKTPASWENIDIPQMPFEQLSDAQQRQLKRMVKRMEKQKTIIPLKVNPDSDQVVGYVFFDESATIKHLRRVPYIEGLFILFFAALGIYIITTIRHQEKSLIWVGMAKETAHQFGTPLSSLSGWLMMMRSYADSGDTEAIGKTIDDMDADVQRLQLAANRFGKVGSNIKLQQRSLDAAIAPTVDYFTRRLPQRSNAISLQVQHQDPALQVRVDPDLFSWALENVIKNSMDALKGKAGSITISTFRRKGNVVIRICDTGCGMAKSKFRDIFEPGITSKERGWGLGLSLARRIVEDYHAGRIRVAESEIDKGTTIEMTIPEV
jgi:hypothetical protein